MTTPRVTVPVEQPLVDWFSQFIERHQEGCGSDTDALIACLDRVRDSYHSLSAAPAPEGGAVGDDDRQPGELELAIRELLWPFFESAKLGHFTHENDCSRAARQVAGALRPGFYLSRFLPALATREEAPAEAGEPSLVDWFSQFIERHQEGCGSDTDALIACLDRVRDSYRAQPQAREGDDDRPIEATWANGKTHAYVNLSAALSAERKAWRQKLGLRIASVRYLDVEVPQAREEAQPVHCHHEAYQGYCAHCGVKIVNGYAVTPKPHPAPDALRSAVEALGPFARAADKLDGHWSEDDWRWNDSVLSGVTVRDIRRARQALAALQAGQKGGAA